MGNSRLRPQKKVSPLSFLSLDYLPSSGRLSSPGHKSFFSTFSVSKTTEHDGGGARGQAGFLSRKRPKRPNLGGQAGDTLTHLKALILIHNTTQVNKKWCLPPAWTSQPACQRDPPPFRREKLFFKLDQAKAEVA